MSWPHDLPPDIHRRLETVLGFRSFGAADVWGVVREWLEEIRAEPPPDGLRPRRAARGLPLLRRSEREHQPKLRPSLRLFGSSAHGQERERLRNGS